MFAPKRLLFRLELHGRVIYEVYSDDVKSDITIGRNGDNSWIIPEEDRSASGRHARIVFKNKNFNQNIWNFDFASSHLPELKNCALIQ